MGAAWRARDRARYPHHRGRMFGHTAFSVRTTGVSAAAAGRAVAFDAAQRDDERATTPRRRRHRTKTFSRVVCRAASVGVDR